MVKLLAEKVIFWPKRYIPFRLKLVISAQKKNGPKWLYTISFTNFPRLQLSFLDLNMITEPQNKFVFFFKRSVSDTILSIFK